MEKTAMGHMIVFDLNFLPYEQPTSSSEGITQPTGLAKVFVKFGAEKSQTQNLLEDTRRRLRSGKQSKGVGLRLRSLSGTRLVLLILCLASL